MEESKEIDYLFEDIEDIEKSEESKNIDIKKLYTFKDINIDNLYDEIEQLKIQVFENDKITLTTEELQIPPFYDFEIGLGENGKIPLKLLSSGEQQKIYSIIKM